VSGGFKLGSFVCDGNCWRRFDAVQSIREQFHCDLSLIGLNKTSIGVLIKPIKLHSREMFPIKDINMSNPQDETSDWYSQDAATFGDRVSAAREQSGLTQKDLARRLGVRTSTVRNWEDDLSEPRANRLSMMAGLLNVSMMWLINGKGEGMDSPPDTGEVTPDMRAILNELRELRADMVARAEQMARLEKRLRLVMSENGE
jgi:DNA-binding transcriptional regulator YiaG